MKHPTAVTPLAKRRASRSIHSLGARRAGCLGRPWPASLRSLLRSYTLGVLPRACARPLRARASFPAQPRRVTLESDYGSLTLEGRDAERIAALVQKLLERKLAATERKR